MYKKFESRLRPAVLSDIIHREKIYRCKKDVKCHDGMFEKGTLVVMWSSNDKKNILGLVEFSAMCSAMLKEHYSYFCSSIVIDESDTIEITPAEFSDYFEEEATLSQRWHDIVTKRENFDSKLAVVTFVASAAAVAIFILTAAFTSQIQFPGFPLSAGVALLCAAFCSGVCISDEDYKPMRSFLKEYSGDMKFNS